MTADSDCGATHNKSPADCRFNDNPALPAVARLPINRCNLPAVILGSLTFQQHPSALRIDGITDLHRDLFAHLAQCADAEARNQRFHDYMTVHFCLETLEEAGLSEETPKNRGRLNYLKLIRGWHFNSDESEGAILKSWVESRFGLMPRYHGSAIRSPDDASYLHYQAQRARGIYNTNAIEAQLDLVYTYTQHELACRFSDKTHFRLFRGVNQWKQHEQLGQRDGQSHILLNNLNSFSSERERAEEFGDTVFAADIPLSKIFCCAEVMPGKLQGEGEYLVIGGLYSVTPL